MSFIPKVTLRPGSHGDSNRPPKWFKIALGETAEVAGRLIFTPNAKHPALKDLGSRELGPVADPDTLTKMEACYRAANARKKAWRQGRKAVRAARMAQREALQKAA